VAESSGASIDARLSNVQPDHFPRRLWGVMAGLALVWGLNWPAMKIALAEVPPWTFRAFCLVLGALVLVTALRAGGERLKMPPRGQWWRVILVGFLNITLWNILIAFGLALVPAGRGAMLGFTMPALAVPLSIWLLHERATPRKMLGLVLGLGGIALLMGESLAEVGSAPAGALMILGAAASWALGSVLQKRYPTDMPVASYTVWVMVFAALPMVVASTLFEDWSVLQGVGLAAWGGVAYNVFLAFGWAHWAWFKIASEVSVTIFSICILLVPVIGVFSGMIILGERPSWAEYAALLLVVLSVASVLVPARKEIRDA
jgi:drug/metabolite transporter (DMT)-like permease